MAEAIEGGVEEVCIEAGEVECGKEFCCYWW